MGDGSVVICGLGELRAHRRGGQAAEKGLRSIGNPKERTSGAKACRFYQPFAGDKSPAYRATESSAAREVMPCYKARKLCIHRPLANAVSALRFRPWLRK